MKYLALVAGMVFLAGCSARGPMLDSYASPDVFGLDAAGAPQTATRRTAAKSVRYQTASRPIVGEVTGTVSRRANDEDVESAQLAELSRLKMNSPEWWVLKRDIDRSQTLRNEDMRKRLTICTHC